MAYQLISNLSRANVNMDSLRRQLPLLLVTLSLLTSPTIYAQHYASSAVQNTVSERLSGFISYLFISHKVNESTLLFYSSFNKEPGIYALNTVSQKVTKIIDVESFELLEFIHFTGGEGNVLIDLLGKLYVSDGTRSGTNFIGDFGYTDIGNVTTTLVSSVFNKSYANGQFYFYEHDYGSPALTKFRLWRTSGSQADTKEITSDQEFQVIDLYPSPDGKGVVAWGQSDELGNGFWKIDASLNKSTIMDSFEKHEQPRRIGITGAARVRRGLIFCRTEYRAGQRHSTSIWRLSLSNKLVRITEGCSDEMFSEGESVYFFKDPPSFDSDSTVLWRTDGTVTGTNLHLDVSPAPEPGVDLRRRNMCQLGGDIYVNVVGRERGSSIDIGKQVWRISTSKPEAKLLPASSLIACLDSVVAVRASGADRLSFYRPTDDTMINSHGLRDEFPSSGAKGLDEVINNYIWEMGEDVFLFNTWYQDGNYTGGQGTARFGTRVVRFKYKDGKFLGYMPSILQVLD